ncbi:Rad4-domain-containing protein [Melanomma pulvis-pyrius CBS 109.77]|uniref:Rad4-domain-containing protein n=1 Tax=Melanomma pulvis-pyrius CBS 109.77 TaxID=1314802 RepID=A0A6A6X4J0_9PLEO|nr:Rad4-domain-containing protein [Melanomma pulvis-pyrius CBS 109.77]
MPPFIPRKRARSSSPAPEPPPKRIARNSPARRGKESVFQTLDAPPTATRTLSQTKALLDAAEDDSDLSESSEEEFEEVAINGLKAKGKRKAQEDEDSSESEAEDWEDALGIHHSGIHNQPNPVISGDIALTISSLPAAFSGKPDGKKGPSKIERHIRNMTHCMHVQFLMFHNLTRNSWIQDQQVQKILVENMTTGCWREMDKYWRDAGISNGKERVVKGAWSKKKADMAVNGNIGTGKWIKSGKNGVKVFESPTKGKGSASIPAGKIQATSGKNKEPRSNDRNQRDWGASSDRLELNAPNLSAGDPLLRLLQYLSAYWKAKFKVTAPSLRKRGYLSPATLEAEIKAWKEDPSDPGAFGERIENLEAFRELARNCEGSRDVGEQLFTALLRGLGIEARMVASLQPAGFGWSKVEEGKPKDLDKIQSNVKPVHATPSTPSTPSRKKLQVVYGTSDSPIDLAVSDTSDLSSVISISSGSELDTKPFKKTPRTRKYDELPHPTYWTEAISNLTHTPIAVSPLPRNMLATSSTPDALSSFYCRGAAADKAKQVFAYLIAFSSDGTAKDVTTRYLPKHQWPGRTKGFRVPIEKIPIHNKRGKVKKWEEWDWFKSVLRPYARDRSHRQPWDEVEEEGDLVPSKSVKVKETIEDGGKETLQGYKNSAKYVLERHLRREEALKPGAKIVRYFTTGKGDNEKKEPVYQRKDVALCKTVESWHKEGREVKEGHQPLKYVPMRAVTVNRKREIEERERLEGEKVTQGLYSKSQTDWIIPDPIQDGKIPRNAFGNIDVYVPTMIPAGAVHIPLRGAARVCKKLKIDFAEACTGFEFGKQRAVPVLTGVVVAAENEDLVIDAWEVDEAEKIKKEQEKKEKLVLGLWKKFFVGLRIVERMKREYGDDVELPAPSFKTNSTAPEKSEWETFRDHENFEGGFLREEPGPSTHLAGGFVHGDEDMAGGFLLSSQDESPIHNGELTIDHGDQKQELPNKVAETSYQTPISLHSALQPPVDQVEEDVTGEEKNFNIPTLKPRTNNRTRGKLQAARARGRSRGGKRSSTSRRKVIRSDDEDEDHEEPEFESSQSDFPSDSVAPLDEDDDDPPISRRSKRKAVTSLPDKAPPNRKTTRESEAKVKSHFFAHGSDEETDLSPVKKSSGRGRGRRRGGKTGG